MPSLRHALTRLFRLVRALTCTLLAGVAGLAFWRAAAAPNFAFTPDFVIRSWQSADGLPENSVTAIVQPSDGALWFGTFNGLIRFDGTEFEPVADPDAGLPADAGVLALLQTRDGRLWVSTTRGIVVLERGRVLKGVGQVGWPVGELVRSWTETPEGLVAVSFMGLCFRFHEGRWDAFPEPGAKRAGFHVQADDSGQLWAVKYPQLFRWNGSAWSGLSAPGMSNAIGLCRRATGGVRLITEDGLWRAEQGRLTRDLVHPFDGFPFWSLDEDSQGRVWMTGYRYGLRLFQPDGVVRDFTLTNGLTSESLRVTFEDRQRNVWVGTSGGGVMRFSDRRFEMLGPESGLGEPAVNSLRWDRQGGLLVATQGGGTYRLRNNQYALLDGQQRSQGFRFAHGVVEDREGVLWLASELGVFRRVNGDWEQLGDSMFVLGGQNSLHLDHAGQVWVGCVNGIAVWRQGQMKFLTAPVAGSSFVHFVDDPDGGMFVSSAAHGLWHVDGQDHWQHVLPAILGEQSIHALHWADGALWISTSGLGFARLREGNLAFVSLPGVDRTAAVLSFLDDGRGNLWLACRRGLIRLPFAEAHAVADGQKAEPEMEVFGLDDGLVTLEFRRHHQPAAVRSPDGRMWFATLAGVLRFDPTQFGKVQRPPSVRLRHLRYLVPVSTNTSATEVTVRDFSDHVLLPVRSSFLEFAYAGFNFSAPEDLRYRFRLQPENGEEVAWREVAERRIAYFPVLPPGHYRFQVTAARLGQPWNPTPAEVTFEIPPRWWEQRRVRLSGGLVAAALFISGVWLFFSLRTRTARQRLEREKVLLDQRRETEEQNSLLRELLDQSADSVFVFELPGGSLIDSSATASRLVGFPRAGFLGTTPQNLGLLPADQSWDQFVASLRADTRVRFETELRRQGGTSLPVEVDARMSHHDGRDFVLAIARDVSERRSAEERQNSLERQLREAQKLEAVGRLAGGIAHDFNNLLQVIRGYTDIVRQDSEMDRVTREESLGEVSRAAARASDLTRQLLAFSRREAVEMRRCALAAVVEESLKMLRPLVGTHIQIQLRAQPDLPPVLADTGQLTQVLLNLAANARDAMPEGGCITLGLREVRRPPAGDETPPWALSGRWVELAFSDTGVGIPPDRLGRIFEPFYTTKERGKGTGLGLAVVYGVVQQHQARIEVESTPGVGSTFRLLFPVCDIADEAVPPQSSNAPAGLSTESRKLLVVDDETTILQLAERVLSGAGHLVFPTTNGRSAIETFAANADAIDLVVLDVLMPGMTGWVAARELRRIRADVPILFCSGYAPDEIEREIASLPRSRLLLKPFTPTQLLMEVQLLASQHPRAAR